MLIILNKALCLQIIRILHILPSCHSAILPFDVCMTVNCIRKFELCTQKTYTYTYILHFIYYTKSTFLHHLLLY